MDWLAAHAGVIGLIFFLVFFLATTAWIFRPGAKQSYQEKASIPFKEMKND